MKKFISLKIRSSLLRLEKVMLYQAMIADVDVDVDVEERYDRLLNDG